MNHEPRPNASTITDEQLDEILRQRDYYAQQHARAERTITETAEILRSALRRLERGRD